MVLNWGRMRRPSPGGGGGSGAGVSPERVAALEAMIGKGSATTTLSFLLGGTQTVRVTLNKSFANGFLPLAGISSQSAGLLGTVSIKEARWASVNQIDVVLVSTSVLSNVQVTVVAVGIGM